MTERRGYVTVSLTKGISDAMDELIEELGYWPSRGAFAREACIKMIREEWPRLETKEEPSIERAPMRNISGAPMSGQHPT